MHWQNKSALIKCIFIVGLHSKVDLLGLRAGALPT